MRDRLSELDSGVTKMCRKCLVAFPATLEHFYAERNGKYGLRSICKSCFREQDAERAKARRSDPEQDAAYRARRRAQEKARGPRVRTPEQIARLRVQQNQWRARKLQEIWAGPEDQRRQYLARRVQYERQRKLRLPPPLRNLSTKVWRQRKRANGGTLTAAQVRAKYEQQGNLCHWCHGPLGDTPHIDHVIPVSKGGPNNDENTVLACPTCNHRKGNLDPEEWLKRLGTKPG